MGVGVLTTRDLSNGQTPMIVYMPKNAVFINKNLIFYVWLKHAQKQPYTKPFNMYAQHIKSVFKALSNYIINQLTTKKSTQVH